MFEFSSAVAQGLVNGAAVDGCDHFAHGPVAKRGIVQSHFNL